jgi:hypothetical protein
MDEKTNVVQLNNPPPVADETPPDPNVVGMVTPQETEMLANLRKQGTNILLQIGITEARKMQMLGALNDNEEQSAKAMSDIAKRLGLPEGQKFQILPDGKVRLVANPMVQPPM